MLLKVKIKTFSGLNPLRNFEPSINIYKLGYVLNKSLKWGTMVANGEKTHIFPLHLICIYVKIIKIFAGRPALVAQGIEQRTSNPQVVGSIPTQGAKYSKQKTWLNQQPRRYSIWAHTPVWQ